DRAPDYESGGQEFESLRARQLTFCHSLAFPFVAVFGKATVCNWFANFVRGEFSKLKIACSARPRVRARYRSRIRCTVLSGWPVIVAFCCGVKFAAKKSVTAVPRRS